jgi:2-polyprenyl-6-methoxyphenol hydroxylase-like FAD-dependent oxidoreductase
MARRAPRRRRIWPLPIAGLGTSLALVGAYVLAGELASAVGDHERHSAQPQRGAVLVAQGQSLARGNAIGLIPWSRTQIWFRNQTLRALPYLPWKGMITGGVQKAANAITLKDYRVYVSVGGL